MFVFRSAGGDVVGDVGNDVVGLFDHPLVTVVYSKAFGDRFNPVRENGLGIVRCVKFALFFRHNGGSDEFAANGKSDVLRQSHKVM